MDANEEADFDALLILLHDWRSGGEFGNWNKQIVDWATERLQPRIQSSIQHTIRRLKPTAPSA